MIRLIIVSTFLVVTISLWGQSTRTLNHIQIARDQWGVPHIYAPTDKEVAYGLAWVQCEDDFKTVQEQLLAIRGHLGQLWGKKGIVIDFGIKFMGLREEVEARYDKEVSTEFKDYLQRFADGINSYAALHQEEVLLKKLFPVTPKDIITGYLLGLSELTGVRKHLESIINETVLPYAATQAPKGSNAFAFSKRITADQKTYLAINSHQPLEGWYSWYEAHLMSDEGMNVLGGTFPIGVSILLGTNEHLGWAHTVNHPDLTDVYQLTMHPDKKHYYRFDGQWLKLEKRRYSAKLKVLGFLNIPISRTIYHSVYGPTFKTDKGYFALRAVAALNVQAAEQWYKMTKAKNYTEFYECLRINGIAGMNIVYADRDDHIFYISNGRFPKRDPHYNWQTTLPGDTSATLWQLPYYPIDSLPQVLDPPSGYVFNTNNSPFVAAALGESPKEIAVPHTMGFKPKQLDNNRSLRFQELMAMYEAPYSYETFKAIKFDVQYPQKIMHHQVINMGDLFELDTNKYSDIADALQLLQSWNRRADLDNTGAALFGLVFNLIRKQMEQDNRLYDGAQMLEGDAVEAIREAKKVLLEKAGRIDVPLGKFQHLTRGDLSLPIAGGPDLLRAVYTDPYIDGPYGKNIAGDSYLQLVRYSEKGVEIESIHSYGASAKASSPHYTDQMSLFVKDSLKVMTLDREKVFEQAKRIYSPLEVIE